MRTTLALLIASTALTVAIGVPAWGAMSGSAEPEERPLAVAAGSGEAALPLIFVSDDDDGDDHAYRRSSGRDDDDDDDCDDDDDDDEGCRGAGNPAPAGSVAPPANGLFGNGAPPQVKVN